MHRIFFKQQKDAFRSHKLINICINAYIQSCRKTRQIQVKQKHINRAKQKFMPNSSR